MGESSCSNDFVSVKEMRAELGACNNPCDPVLSSKADDDHNPSERNNDWAENLEIDKNWLH